MLLIVLASVASFAVGVLVKSIYISVKTIGTFRVLNAKEHNYRIGFYKDPANAKSGYIRIVSDSQDKHGL